MIARLTTRPIGGALEVSLDCRHAVTTAWLINGQAAGLTLTGLVETMIASRLASEPCACVRKLADRRRVAV